MKIVSFYDRVYLSNYFIVVGDGNEAIKLLNKKALKEKIDYNFEFNVDRAGRMWHIPNYGFIIWLYRFNNSPYDYSTLVHELTHCTIDLFDEIGMVYGADNSEQFTYYLGFLTETVLTLLKKK